MQVLTSFFEKKKENASGVVAEVQSCSADGLLEASHEANKLNSNEGNILR